MQKPLLIDLDGVLRVKNMPAEDLTQFLNYIESNSIPACILSNSSISSYKQILQFFKSHSIQINIPIITAIDAAQIYVSKKYKKVAAYTSENVIHLFADYLDYDNPEAIVIGDIGDVWNYKLMQTIFEYVRNGAELIAAHKNKFWEKPDVGIQLDAGPFIHAIEYATNTKATLIGKPSSLYFQSALDKIGYDKETKFIMLGDDLDTDMSGAKRVGAETILIYTGKTNKPFPKEYVNNVDREANSLQDVIEILNKE